MNLFKSLRMLDENTIEIIFHDRIKIEVDGMKEAYNILDDYTNKKRLKKLVIVGQNTDISREARKYGHIESKTRKDIVIAEAMVVHTLPQKMVANFYFNFIKDSYPTKYFTEIEKAREWLDSIKN